MFKKKIILLNTNTSCMVKKSLKVETCKNDSLQIGNSNNTNYTHI